MCKQANIRSRVKVLGQTGLSSMLWSIESRPLDRASLEKLDGALTRKVMHMLGKTWTSNHSLGIGAWKQVVASQAKRIILSEIGDVASNAFRRQWRFLGHIARSSDSLLRDLLRCRQFHLVKQAVKTRA
eukprot:368755-Karenia_brevis.AAC.1